MIKLMKVKLTVTDSNANVVLVVHVILILSYCITAYARA